MFAEMPFSRLNIGRLQIVIASIAFGFLGLFGKMAFAEGISVGELLTYRFSLAALSLWAWVILLHPSWIRISFYQLLVSALLGILGYAVFATLYFTAIEGMSISLAAMLLYTYPIWVTVISAAFKFEKVTSKDWAALGGASLGLVALLWGQININNFLALLAGLGSALCYAIYIVVSGRLQKNIRPITSSLYVITFAAITLFYWHQPHFPNILKISHVGGWAVIGSAFVCTILPLTLVLAGLQKMRSSEAALLTMVEPLAAVFLGVLIWNETLSAVQITGAVLLVGCISLKAYLHR